ncbi:hypothetical protein [Sporosarcina phage Lietuvens]|nr:hypothetical protein [Sporosarcina phage Lietuvens]
MMDEIMSGHYGIFIEGKHYKTCTNEKVAVDRAMRYGVDCSVRELTLDEYYERWRVILAERGYY